MRVGGAGYRGPAAQARSLSVCLRAPHVRRVEPVAVAVLPAPQVKRRDEPEKQPHVAEVQDLVEQGGKEHGRHGGAE